MNKYHMFEAQLGFLGMSGGLFATTAIKKFRYTSKSTYWDNAKTGTDTNFNKLSDDIFAYGTMALMAIAFLSQAASLAGIGAATNLMVWNLGVALGLPAISFTCLGLSIMAWEQGYDSKDAKAAYTQAFAKNGMVSNLASVSAFFMAGLHNFDSWTAAQWIALGEEAQTEMIMELETKVKAIAEEEMAKGKGEGKKGEKMEEGEEMPKDGEEAEVKECAEGEECPETEEGKPEEDGDKPEKKEE